MGKFGDSLDQVGVVLLNTLGKYVNSGGFGWEWHLLWGVVVAEVVESG